MAASPGSAGALPRLAYVYDGRFPPMAVARQADGICEVAWVIDSGDQAVASMLRVFERFGVEVVDVAGASADEAAELVAAARPVGITTQADARLVPTAEIAERLGLSFMPVAAAQRASDKRIQRVALRDAGVPVPGFWSVPGEDDEDGWRRLADEADFPAVLKPRHGSTSEHVVKVSSFAELRTAFAALPSAVRSDMHLEGYLVDQPGAGGEDFASYVSVESLVADDRVSHLAVSGRTPLVEPFRETCAFTPCALAPADLDAVLEMARAAISALGVSWNCMHTEIKLTPDGPRVIEVNARIGGSVPFLLARGGGIDVLTLVMRAAVGERLSFDGLIHVSGVPFVLWVPPPLGMRRITAVEGVEEWAADRPGDEVTLNRRPGDAVDWREGGGARVVTVSGVAASHDELRELLHRAASRVVIHGE